MSSLSIAERSAQFAQIIGFAESSIFIINVEVDENGNITRKSKEFDKESRFAGKQLLFIATTLSTDMSSLFLVFPYCIRFQGSCLLRGTREVLLREFVPVFLSHYRKQKRRTHTEPMQGSRSAWALCLLRSILLFYLLDTVI